MSAPPRSLLKALRLRCPRCGEHPLFRDLIRMHEACPGCRLRFEREAGYFVGAIYVNYGVTVGLAITGYLLLEWWLSPSLSAQLLWAAFFSVVFPVLFFRYARSIWLHLDHSFSREEAPCPPSPPSK